MKVSGFFATLKKVGLDGFIIALILMIFIAWLWPQWGVNEGQFSLSVLAGYGVSAIFFFYGLKLDRQKLMAGLGHWRLHLVVQLSTFVLFPVLVLLFRQVFDTPAYKDLWLGVFFLAALPSTVSSSVVMVSIAGGNMVAAIFNASISSLIGVFVTPLWMQLVSDASGVGIDISDSFIRLLIQVLLPVLVGFALSAKFGWFAEKYKLYLRYFDQGIILVIVYTSFADSFLNRRFATIDLQSIIVLTVLLIALFFVVYFFISWICKLLRFNRADTVAAVFCGSKKSLVHGTVMSKVLFNGSPVMGVLLLPLMIYHAAQLIIASVIARRAGEQSVSPKTFS
ncbi:MAG: bile acid:sodium symporter [Chitinophagaceae bacterium]|nr:MAG: bile acid:sodium symporter [Chitinophagaceae bacterium]